MQDFISNPSVFALITAFFLCGIIFNGVTTYQETKESGTIERLAMYVLHILVSGLAIKGYIWLLYFVNLDKLIN